MTSKAAILATNLLGLSLRYFTITLFNDSLRHRVELTSPISDWRRAREAVHLYNSGLDPYVGNFFHEYPINLRFYAIILSYFNIDVFFALTDVLIANLLRYSVANQLVLSGHSNESAKSKSFYALLIYSLSPINIISCGSLSTTIFTNFLFAAASLMCQFKTMRAITCILCANLIASNLHLTPVILPIFMCMEYCKAKSSDNMMKQAGNQANHPNEPTYYRRPGFYSSLGASLGISFLAFTVLLVCSASIMNNSISFISSTYLFVLKVQDLKPNIGMFWYLFTEVFQHFLSFFTCIIQINSFIHFIPLCIALRDNPFFALFVVLSTSTVFQPYLSLGQIGPILGLLPLWSDLLDLSKRRLIFCCSAITCLCLIPIFWHQWIVLGTGNANFYFGATLVFSYTLNLFTIDVLVAYLRVRASAITKFKKDSINGT